MLARVILSSAGVAAALALTPGQAEVLDFSTTQPSTARSLGFSSVIRLRMDLELVLEHRTVT